MGIFREIVIVHQKNKKAQTIGPAWLADRYKLKNHHRKVESHCDTNES